MKRLKFELRLWLLKKVLQVPVRATPDMSVLVVAVPFSRKMLDNVDNAEGVAELVASSAYKAAERATLKRIQG